MSSLLKEKLLKVVVVATVIGVLAGVAGHFLGFSVGVVGGATAGVCGVIGALVLRRASQSQASQ